MSMIYPSIEVVAGEHMAYQVRFAVPDGKGGQVIMEETLPLDDGIPQTGKNSIEEFLVKRWAGYAEAAARTVAPVHLGFKVAAAEAVEIVEAIAATEEFVPLVEEPAKLTLWQRVKTWLGLGAG